MGGKSKRNQALLQKRKLQKKIAQSAKSYDVEFTKSRGKISEHPYSQKRPIGSLQKSLSSNPTENPLIRLIEVVEDVQNNVNILIQKSYGKASSEQKPKESSRKFSIQKQFDESVQIGLKNQIKLSISKQVKIDEPSQVAQKVQNPQKDNDDDGMNKMKSERLPPVSKQSIPYGSGRQSICIECNQHKEQIQLLLQMLRSHGQDKPNAKKEPLQTIPRNNTGRAKQNNKLPKINPKNNKSRMI